MEWLAAGVMFLALLWLIFAPLEESEDTTEGEPE
jgi:hypothetical protein